VVELDQILVVEIGRSVGGLMIVIAGLKNLGNEVSCDFTWVDREK
jgi:hypothetical protein